VYTSKAEKYPAWQQQNDGGKIAELAEKQQKLKVAQDLQRKMLEHDDDQKAQ